MDREERMLDVVARCEASELTQKAFAAQEGIPYTTLLYWRRRLARSRGASRSRAAVLAPVRIVPDGPRGRSGFDVRTPGGAVVSVPHGFDEGELRRLLAALSRC
jgi:hypothetical protein